MGGGGGSTKSTTVTTPKPMEGMEGIVGDIGSFLEKTAMPWIGGQLPTMMQHWNRPLDQRIAGFQPEQLGAMQRTESLVNMADPYLAQQAVSNINAVNPLATNFQGYALGGAMPTLNDTMAGGYLPTAEQDASRALSMGTMQGGFLPQQQYTTAALDELMRNMTGQYTGAGNPYANDYIDMITRPIERMYQGDVAQAMSAGESAGRQGLGPAMALEAADQRARQMREAATGFLTPMYEGERGRQMQATGQMQDLWNQERTRQQQAQNMANQMWLGERGFQMNAASQIPQLALQGAQLQLQSTNPLLDIINQGFKNYGNLAAVGEQKQGQRQLEMDTMNQAMYEPFSQLMNQYINPLISAATAQTGSSTTQTGGPGTSPLSDALSGGAGLGSLALLIRELMA